MRLFSVRFSLLLRLLLCISLPTPAGLLAQAKPSPASTAKADIKASTDPLAGESYVIERASWVYAMKADGTGYCLRTASIKIQSEAALKVFSVIAVGFASASEHVEFHYARVRRPDGTVTETAVSGAIEQTERVTREAPFYSDLKEEQLPIKNLRVGDTLEWEASIVRTKAEAAGEFWNAESFVAKDAVTLKESIELRVPVSRAVTVWTNPRAEVKPTVTTVGDERVYVWESSQTKPTTGAAADAEKKAKKTRVLTKDEYDEYRYGKLPTAAWTTFKSWADVGAWYRGLEGDRAVPDDEIKAKVAELTLGKATEEEKVRAVYGYVSSQIRYIGVAFGVGRYQPHTAADVLHNQYGDCKDKEMLLASMLMVLGVSSDAALIGSEIRFNEAVPSPAAFNHLITRAHVGGEAIWLDPTAEIAPYRLLYASLRDKEALAIPDKGTATVERTPLTPPFPFFDRWEAKGTLDQDGTSDSHISLSMRGDDELEFRSAVRQVTPAQYDEAGERILRNLGFAGTLTHVEFGRPEDTELPYTFAFDYHREKSGDWPNLKILPQLEPVVLTRFDEKEPPTRPIYLGSLRTETSTAEMKIPDGWKVELPQAVHQKAAFATYDLSYRFENGTIYTERKLTILEERVPEPEWKAYLKWSDDVSLGMDTYIQLRRGGGTRPATAGKNGEKPTTAEGHVSNEDAETLIMQSFTSSDKSDIKTSEALLKRAKALDPQARRLWAANGVLALARNKPNEAIEDFRRELELYPDAFEEYGVIAETQSRQGDKAGAVETMRAWVNADPKDSKANEALAEALLKNGDGAAAADAASAAIALLPEAERSRNEDMQATLGRAQLKAGQTEKATATLVALLKSTDSPAMMNNIGYDLADAKLELPLDEEKVRVSLGRQTVETKSWTLDEAPDTLRAKTSLLLATWDTLGWILFREGKAQEAQGYLEAAWLNSGHQTGWDHLDAVRKTLADGDQDGIEKNWSKARTISLGRFDGRKGFAEYRLLLAHGQVERAKPSGDKTVDGGEEMIKRADVKRWFPAGSEAKLVRTAVLNCVNGKCELLMEP